ncbi:MAG: hypothetical protein ABUK01_19335, partial [Leptospirales bacterium]
IQNKIESWDKAELVLTFELFFKLFSNWSLFQATNSAETLVSLEISLVDLFQKFEAPSVSSLVQKLSRLESALQNGDKFEDQSAIAKKTETETIVKPKEKPIEKPAQVQKNEPTEAKEPPKTTEPKKIKENKENSENINRNADTKVETNLDEKKETDIGQILQKEFGGSETDPDAKMDIFE